MFFVCLNLLLNRENGYLNQLFSFLIPVIVCTFLWCGPYCFCCKFFVHVFNLNTRLFEVCLQRLSPCHQYLLLLKIVHSCIIILFTGNKTAVCFKKFYCYLIILKCLDLCS